MTLAKVGIPADGRPWFCLTLDSGPPSKCLKMPTLSDVHVITFSHLCVLVSLSPLPLEFLLGCFLSLCCGCSFIIQGPAACFVLELALGWLEVVVERGFTCED